MSQRKNEGNAPHIVVVAPVPESRKKSSHSSTPTPTPPVTTTISSSSSTTSPPPSRSKSDGFESASFTRDSDSLLAAAHFLARHHFGSRRNDDRVTLNLEPENEGKRAFESASLLGPQAERETDYATRNQGLSKPVGPRLRDHEINSNRPIIGSVASNLNNAALNGLEESSHNPMASASEHHINYMPPNRIVQASHQMMSHLHPSQLQYRIGQAPQGPPVFGGPIPPPTNMGRANGVPMPQPNQLIASDNGQQLAHQNHGMMHQM